MQSADPLPRMLCTSFVFGRSNARPSCDSTFDCRANLERIGARPCLMVAHFCPISWKYILSVHELSSEGKRVLLLPLPLSCYLPSNSSLQSNGVWVGFQANTGRIFPHLRPRVVFCLRSSNPVIYSACSSRGLLELYPVNDRLPPRIGDVKDS